MLKLNHLSAIRFNGGDAGDFLHNQLSADILGLANGDSTFACYCEPKGRVLALLLVQKFTEGYLVLMSATLATAVTERLKIYRMRSKVEFEILEDYTISGMETGETPELALTSAYTVRLPGSEEWFVVTPLDITQGSNEDLQNAWKVSELSRGITWLNPQTSGEFLPQMLGFEQLGAVNYRKGCYPGQEIVARTHYLGKVKRHPRVLSCKLGHHPKSMDKIKIFDEDQAHDAVVADSVATKGGDICLLAITRMKPVQEARKVEYLDEVTPVL